MSCTGEGFKKETSNSELKGWMYKWTNYIKGYQKRYFVLAKGTLFYYRTPSEMAHTCRGALKLAGSVITAQSDGCHFVITNRGSQTYHLKTGTEVERQKWLTTLELAKNKAVRAEESSEDEKELTLDDQKKEIKALSDSLQGRLEELVTCNELIMKHGTSLLRVMNDLESSKQPLTLAKTISERATLNRITCTAMINSCQQFVTTAQSEGLKWLKILESQHEKCKKLENMVEQIALQQNQLEEQAMCAIKPGKLDHDSDEFFDAEESFSVDLPSSKSGQSIIKSESVSSSLEKRSYEADSEEEETVHARAQVLVHKNEELLPTSVSTTYLPGSAAPHVPARPSQRHSPIKKRKPLKRRSRIPEKPNHSLNLWSFMKNCIGRDLTRIPMPVNFSEPLSMLQRLTEDFENSYLLDKAAACSDPCQQLTYIATFVISAYANTSIRTNKPFNPLLGETYECDRTDDLGWRSLAEQVSHHPPIAALHIESDLWTSWEEWCITSKFRGKYLQVVPQGITHFLIHSTQSHITWRRVTTTVHNIIVGKLWIDHSGELDIVNHTSGEKCTMKFYQYSYFSKECTKLVKGTILDSKGDIKWVIKGTWDEQVEAAKVIRVSTDSRGKQIIDTGPPEVLWKRREGRESETMYNFSPFTIELNEEEADVAPTDTRFRPDQRAMELGEWEKANKLKIQLEEVQRSVRRKREEQAELAVQKGIEYPGYTPTWFKSEIDPLTRESIHVYQNHYWQSKQNQNWEACPEIYNLDNLTE